jgi:hypothetical protein
MIYNIAENVGGNAAWFRRIIGGRSAGAPRLVLRSTFLGNSPDFAFRVPPDCLDYMKSLYQPKRRYVLRR